MLVNWLNSWESYRWASLMNIKRVLLLQDKVRPHATLETQRSFLPKPKMASCMSPII